MSAILNQIKADMKMGKLTFTNLDWLVEQVEFLESENADLKRQLEDKQSITIKD